VHEISSGSRFDNYGEHDTYPSAEIRQPKKGRKPQRLSSIYVLPRKSSRF